MGKSINTVTRTTSINSDLYLNLISPRFTRSHESSDDDIFSINPQLKKYEIIEITEDLLALSCTWYRIRQEQKSHRNKKIYPPINTLLCNELFDLVTAEDREKASTVREYYSKKLTVLTLMEIKFTSFRSDLKEYIYGDGKKFLEKMIPMVYRLPEFYEYDIALEKVKNSIKPELNQDSKKFIRSYKKQFSMVLHPITSLKRENIKVTEYWMKSEDEKNAYCVHVLDNNPLKAIWEQIFFTKNKFSFNTDLTPAIRDGLHYYNLKNYHLSSFG